MVVPNRKLEAARLSKRWSIALASEKVGVSANTFNRWERGLQVPQLSTLDKLCQVFELSPADLGFDHVINARRREHVQVNSHPTPGVQFPRWPVTTVAGIQIVSSVTPLFDRLTHDPVEQCGCTTPVADTCVEQAQRSFDSMDLAIRKGGEGVSRRQAIAALIGTPAAVFGITQGMNQLLHPEEVLSLCTVNIPLSWQLYFEGGLKEVEQLLHSYLSRLSDLAQQPSRYQGRAALLASQGHQLASLVALQHQNFGTAYSHAQQALTYGEQAGDPNLQATSLIRQAQVHLYLKRPRQRLQAYERSLQYLGQTSPLLQGRVYAGLAETHGHLGNQQEAQYFLGLAHKAFPASYSDDPNYVYTHFNLWSISALEGLMYLHIKQPEHAQQTFSNIETLVPNQLVPNRLELMVRQSEAACALNDRDMACAHVTMAARSAITAGNELRYNEIYHVYEQMQGKWGRDTKVRELEDLFR
ncbi:MAG: helix-turn-helix transcriptional regulator [Ktedonobacteraceae bacterium]|nr:helix-turn-helix transcriptional regulator [Ktedonobacteraceae bacterium]